MCSLVPLGLPILFVNRPHLNIRLLLTKVARLLAHLPRCLNAVHNDDHEHDEANDADSQAGHQLLSRLRNLLTFQVVLEASGQAFIGALISVIKAALVRCLVSGAVIDVVRPNRS